GGGDVEEDREPGAEGGGAEAQDEHDEEDREVEGEDGEVPFPSGAGWGRTVVVTVRGAGQGERTVGDAGRAGEGARSFLRVRRSMSQLRSLSALSPIDLSPLKFRSAPSAAAGSHSAKAVRASSRSSTCSSLKPARRCAM